MLAGAPSTEGRLVSRPTGPGRPPVRERGLQALAAIGLQDHLLLVPETSAGRAPLLVFFHGAGGHAAGSVAYVREAAAAHGALVLLPSSAAGTWDLLVGGLGRDVAALDAALAHVFASHDVDRVALGGFSDGASYALSLGAANGDLVDALLAFSPGFAAPPVQVGRPRTWVSHGTSDAVLPVDRCGRRVVQQLRADGYEVEYEEFDGGHVVPGELVDAAFRWWLGGP